MIAWLQPAALWALVLVSVPFLIHLLRARNAPRVSFPTIRFVRSSAVAAVRVGDPSDLLLLAIRSGLVGLAVLALAQPLILSNSRLERWNSRVARAIVIDRSASMGQPQLDGGSPAVLAADVATAERASASAAFQVESDDLRDGLRRAAAWLRSAPPARREIVVLSDFQHGSLTQNDLARLPTDVGLRFLMVGEGPAWRQAEGVPLLTAPGINARRQRVELLAEGTRVTMLDAGLLIQPGLRLITTAGADEEQRLLRAVARAGAPAPSGDQPIAVQFLVEGHHERVAPLRDRWMIQTVIGLERDPELQRLARSVEAGTFGSSDGWMAVMQDRRGRPMIRAASRERELVIDVAAPVSSYFGAATVRAALVARYGRLERPEQEVLNIPKQTLSAWNRPAALVGADAWQHAESSDARWCWAAALGLLALEQWLRSRKRIRTEEHRAAA